MSPRASASAWTENVLTPIVDNVRLTVAVPEPTAAVLLGLGLAGLVIRKRRQS